MEKSCEVCGIQDGAYVETEHWRVILAYKQAYLGRSIASLKRHCGDLADLTDEEWTDLHVAIRETQRVLRKAFDVTVFNWGCLMNHAFQEKPYNPHVHCHVLPRYDHPVTVGDRTYEDDRFGRHYDPERGADASPEELVAIRGRINEAD